MNHVFLSYDHADDEFVRQLMNELQNAGLSVWKDSYSLHAGDDWRARIDDAIKTAYALVVVITPESTESEYVSYEWACGLGAGVKLIPILLRNAELPQRLASMHYLDFTDPVQRPWERLIAELTPAHRPMAAGRSDNVPPVVQKAVEALDSIDSEEQSRALRVLTQIDHPSAREALVAAVHHYNREIRIKAALELSRFKDVRAMPGLIDAQRAWQLRWEFVRIVASLGPPAIPALLEAVRDEDVELREYAAHALGELRQSVAAPALRNLLEDVNGHVREAAAKALEKIASA